MSVHKMIPSPANLGWAPSEELVIVGRHAMFCAVICACSADACAAEEEDLGQCIRSCLDCADICDATARLVGRRTGHNIEALRAMLETCANVCALCASECDRHDFAHCHLCAEMCRAAEADCLRALLSLA